LLDLARSVSSLIHGLSPCTARLLRGREEARSAGWWGSFEGWRKATPPCEERGAEHGVTSTFQQTMTGEGRAGHGRQRFRDRKRISGRRHDRREARLAEWSGSGTERSAGGAGLGRPEGVWSAG